VAARGKEMIFGGRVARLGSGRKFKLTAQTLA
jgi:hypothetical protein